MGTTNDRYTYVTRIRNPDKKRYARAYESWRCSDRSKPEPRPPVTLSYLAAQAVRMRLDELT